MCGMLDSERAQLMKLAAETDDPMLSNAILLILRGSALPQPVVQRLLNAGAMMLDAHDVAKKIVGA